MKEEALPSAVPLMTMAEITLEQHQIASKHFYNACNLQTTQNINSEKGWYQPENKHVFQALVLNQIASICEGSSVCHEDDTPSKAKTDPIDGCSLFG